MATRADARNKGFGGKVLQGLIGHVADRGGGLVWCTARLGAVDFYMRHGFLVRGEPLRVPGLGPHLTMSTEVG